MTHEDDLIAIECRKCGMSRMAKVIGSDSYSHPHTDDIYRMSLVRCVECESRYLLLEDGEYLPVGYLPDGEAEYQEFWNRPKFLWPAENRNFDFVAPESVSKSYNEALRCYESGAFTAATIMGRRTVEIICHELGASKKKSLYNKIDELSSSDVFSGKLGKWAHRLREIGNIAAHQPDAEFNKKQAKLFLDFTEALIDSAFVLESKFQEFEDFSPNSG